METTEGADVTISRTVCIIVDIICVTGIPALRAESSLVIFSVIRLIICRKFSFQCCIRKINNCLVVLQKHCDDHLLEGVIKKIKLAMCGIPQLVPIKVSTR